MRPFTLAALLVWAAFAPAADWPMGGRGGDRNPVCPEGNGPVDWHIPEFERTPPDTSKPRNLRWSAAVGSRAIGGPVVAGGLVWVGTNDSGRVDADDGSKDHAVLACFRESDGKPVYRYLSLRLAGGHSVDWPGQSLSGSPLAEGDRLWFCTNRREVVCLDVGPLQRGTGQPKLVWKLDMIKELGLQPHTLMIPGTETQGSPAAYKGLLFAPTGTGKANVEDATLDPKAPSLVCVRKETGKVVWSDNSPGKDLLPGHYASPTVIEVGGRALVVMPQGDGWVRAFEAETGRPAWRFDVNPKGAKKWDWGSRSDSRRYVVATPVFAGGRLFFATGLHPEINAGPGRLFCVDPSKRGDISPELDDGQGGGKPNPNSGVVWEYAARGDRLDRVMHESLGSVAVSAGLVIAADRMGVVHCLDAATGRAHWTHDTKGRVDAHPLVVGKAVYVASSGEVFLFALGRAKRLIARHESDATSRASPVFANGALYLLTDGRLYAVAVPAGGEEVPPPRRGR